jgi:hypothetical protein
MRLAGHVARIVEMINAYKILVGNLDNLGTDMKVILKWILGNWGGKVWTDFIWLRTGTSGGQL